MKKIIAFLVFVIIIFSACSSVYKFEVGESMNKLNNKYTPFITINALSVYEIGENYLIIIDDGGIIQKLVEFSRNRKCCRIQGLDLIKDDYIEQFLNTDFDQLVKKIGRPHVDVGSGFYIPAYVTEDANLICFELENDIVTEVVKRDLLTNKIVDRISN